MRSALPSGTKRAILTAGVAAAHCCGGAAASALRQDTPDGRQTKEPAKKIKNRGMSWKPPDVDSAPRGLTASPPCVLSEVLEQAGARAKQMEGDLPNFTADERIQFQQFDNIGELEDAAAGTFEYLALITPEDGGRTVQETRTPTEGTRAFPASTQDTGLPEMALIFLPNIQGDYEMKCEGTGRWKGEPTWVVHFQQRPDRSVHTLSFHGKTQVYGARLKGRAWIAEESGDVMHLELETMEAIPQMQVRNWWLSIDYAPVQFHSQNVRIWLPQAVDAYAQFEDRRTIIYHTFANFLLFSVQTKQQFEKPSKPE